MTNPDWHCVNHTEAAQAHLNPQTFKNFAVFLGQEQSLSKAAKILGQPASSLKYHLEKFK
jgi:hypothetical protein